MVSITELGRAVCDSLDRLVLPKHSLSDIAPDIGIRAVKVIDKVREVVFRWQHDPATRDRVRL